MINLELTDLYSQRVIDINKINYLLIGKYDGYLEFYTYFYELLINKNKDYKIRFDNSVIDSKNSLFFDFTSLYNVLLSLEFKKGSLLYEHMILRLNLLGEIWEEKFDDLFSDLINFLNKNDEDFQYCVSDEMKKIITQAIQVSCNKKNIKNTFLNVLEEFLNNCNNKNIIIFINSRLIEFDFTKFDNVLLFDISDVVSLKKYNLISLNEVKELDFEFIKNKIEKDYPINFRERAVYNCISAYYRYLLTSKTVFAYSNEELIVYTLLSKYNNFNQQIIPKNLSVNDNIKSFLANI